MVFSPRVAWKMAQLFQGSAYLRREAIPIILENFGMVYLWDILLSNYSIIDTKQSSGIDFVVTIFYSLIHPPPQNSFFFFLGWELYK